MISKFQKSVPEIIKFSFGLLDRNAKRKLIYSGIVLSLLGILDLIAIAILAITTSVTLDAINSNVLSTRIQDVLEFFHLDNQNVYVTVGFLVSLMVTLFVVRTVISLIFSSKVYNFLAYQNNVITKEVLIKLLNQDIRNLRKLPTQEIVFALTNGLNAAVVGINGLIISTIADLFLSIILVGTLILFNPASAFISIFILLLFTKFLYKVFNQKIRKISLTNTDSTINANKKILEILETYPESIVRNTRENYIKEISYLRAKVSESIAAQSILPNISKYTMELSLMIGGVLISAVMFIMFDAVKALTGLTLFIAVGSRISPAFLRLQQNFLSYRMNQSWAGVTKKLLDILEPTDQIEKRHIQMEPHSTFGGCIEVSNLYFKYDQSKVFGLENVNLTIPTGSFTAFVGNSGSGKTTLADLILGFLTPDSGSITISGVDPLSVHRKWPGVIAYVPQDVIIIDDTVVKNITLGFDSKFTDKDYILQCIKLAHLSEVISALPEKLEEILGEKGSNLSGGQRQRIGIARALYTKPKILVLDEATSALDGESEKEINDSIQDLKGEVTVIMIAHRLSSVVNADQVVYIEDGKLVAIGSFAEVRKESTTFNNQAILMGL
jgi:ABC-type multidrug transport system fused ATPase/permease subunit